MPRTKEIVAEVKIDNLASNIRKRRRWLGLTQDELGKKIGVTQQRIAMFEKGDSIPDIFQMQNIASVLNTTIGTLLNLTTEETMNNQITTEETMNNQITMDHQLKGETTMNILASMQAREQLLESLNLRINDSQGEASSQIQEWIGNLKEQQLSDIDLYKNSLLLSGQLQQEPIDISEPAFNEQDNWSEQFAEGFIAHLNDEDGSLLDLWLGRRHSYPTYIGFDIRNSEGEFDFFAHDTYWLAANLREKQVFAGIHFRDPLYFQQLETQKNQINLEFAQEFGRPLEWRPTTGNAGIYRISVLVGVDHNHSQNLLFEPLCQILEKLNEIFKDRLDTISQLLLSPTRRPYNP